MYYMGQPQLRQVMIGGAGPRSSLFTSSVVQGLGFHASPTLGVTNVEWYERAKKAIAQFDELLVRLGTVANKTERERLIAWIGDPSDSANAPAAYRYSSVVSDLADDVERFTPPNYGAYDTKRRTNRIEKLEDYNAALSTAITDAENVYGVLPPGEQVTVTRTQFIEGPTDYMLPLIAAGAAAVGVGLLFMLLGKK